MNGYPPAPRTGRLMAGGANSLELLWATLTLVVVGLVAVAAGIGWLALSVEAGVAGTGPAPSVWEILPILADPAGHPTVTRTVVAPWRPLAIATIAGLAAIAVAVWGLRGWVSWQAGARHRQRARDRHRSPTWAKPRQLAPLLTHRPHPGRAEPSAAGRLWVGTIAGHDVCVPASTSVMAIAPTRTGKSTRLVVPNLLRWDGPAVVTSVKRDVYDLTVARRSQAGPVCLFDPTGATGLATVRWSPLLTSTSFADATKTAAWLTDAASVEDRHDNAKFWETLATKLLAPMLYAAANTARTIHHVSHWVDRSAFEEVAVILESLGDTDAQAAWQAITELPADTRGSVLGTAMALFRAFGSPRVRAATSCTPGDTDNTLDIAGLLAGNGTLYLVSPEYEQTELRPVFVALIQAVYRTAVTISANRLGGAPLNPPLLLMLDEAGNIAPLKSLPKIAATGAGQGITLMTIWQDRAQIRGLYGNAERTVIANHTSSVWLPGSQDLDTLRLLSDLIGDQSVATTSIAAAPDGGLSVTEASERIQVAPPAFLRILPHGSAVLLSGNLPPALIATHAWYQQHRWRRHIHPHTVARYTAMHDGTGPTTAQHTPPHHDDADARPAIADTSADADPETDPDAGSGVGSLGRALGAAYRPVDCNLLARNPWGIYAAGIPDQLSGAPGTWRTIQLPSGLAALAGTPTADLTDVPLRRRLLAAWVEHGPAHLLAAAISFRQLADEWPHLQLPDDIRNAWHDSYPQLGDDYDTVLQLDLDLDPGCDHDDTDRPAYDIGNRTDHTDHADHDGGDSGDHTDHDGDEGPPPGNGGGG